MKRISLIALMILACTGFAVAQIGAAPATDVLGAHLNYGRGCAGCHAPHSGARGNGIATTDASTGNVALWGEDVAPLVGQTLIFGGTGKATGNGYSELLPAVSAGSADVSGVLMCLSCHDGSLAKGAMMTGTIYETLPATYGAAKAQIPTFLGNDGTGAENYLNDHPVGYNAVFPCGGYGWDCTISAAGKISPGPLMTQFIGNYGFFTVPSVYNGTTPIVVCTTCHNQHSMNVVAVTQNACIPNYGATPPVTCSGTSTGLPTGKYATMFFIKAPYNPASTTQYSNQTAQFCRQCHGGESNEMNGGTAGTTF